MNKNLKNISSLFSAEILVRLLALAATSYIARVLGKDSFGVVSVGLAILSYAVIISNGGLTLMGTKKVASGNYNLNSLTKSIFSARLILSTIVFVIIYIIFSIYNSGSVESKLVILYATYIFPAALLLDWYYLGKQQMNLVALGRVIGMLIYLIGIVLFINSIVDILSVPIVWTVGISANVIVLLLLFFFKQKNEQTNSATYSVIGILKESFPLASGAILSQLVMQFPIIYLSFVESNSTVGTFSAAFKTMMLFLILDRVFNSLFFPKIVNCFNNTPDKLNEIFDSIVRIILWGSISIAVLSVCLSDFLINIIFGNDFLEAGPQFNLLILFFVLTLVNSVYTYTLISINKEKVYTKSLLIGLIFFILCGVVLTNYYSVWGMIIGLIVFEVVTLLYMSLKLREVFNVLQAVVPIMVLSGIAILMYVLLNFGFGVIINMMITFFLIIPLTFVVVGVSKDDIKFIKRIFI